MDNSRSHWWPALALLCMAPMLLVLPPVPIDETRYLSVAWEMRLSGAWLAPHLNGAPYFDKPPLLFWLVNLCWSVLGVSLWSARMVSLICGAMCVLLGGRLQRALADDAEASAGWLLAGSMFFALFSGVVMFDVVLCLCVLIGFLAIVAHVRQPSVGALFCLACASCLGIFAKGPVMLLHLAGPIVLARWWARGGTLPGWRSIIAMLACALAGSLPVLLWAWLSLRGLSAQDADDLLLKQTAGRVVESFAHNRPLWWYLPFVPALLLPWVVTWRWRRLYSIVRGSGNQRVVRFGASACLPALAAFSVISGKQLHYLLPLLPGACLIISGWKHICVDMFPVRRWIYLALLVAAATAWSYAHTRLAPGSVWLHAMSAAFMLCALMMGVVFRHSRQLAVAGVASLLLTAALIPVLRVQVMAPMNPQPLASRVAELQRDGVPLVRSANEPGMLGFLGRLPQPLPESPDLLAWAHQHPQGFVLAYKTHGHPPADASNAVRLANGWIGLLPSPLLPAHPEIWGKREEEAAEP